MIHAERTDAYGDPLPAGALARAGTVRLWHPGGGVRALAFSPTEPLLVSAGYDGTVRLWSPDSGAEVNRLVGHDGSVRAVTFTPDGTHLVSAGRDGTVRVWDVRAAVEARRFTFGDDPCALCVTPDGQSIAVALAGTACVQLRDAQSGKLQQSFSLGDCSPTRVYLVISPDGMVLAALSMDSHTREAKTLFAWDVQTSERTFFRELDTSSGRNWRDYAAVYEIGTWRLLSELPKVDTATVLPSGEIIDGSRLGPGLRATSRKVRAVRTPRVPGD